MSEEISRRVFLAGVSAFSLLGEARRAAAAEFFTGKTLAILCGYNPGGGVDLGTRLIAENIGAYIPGKPKVIVQNMEGAAGIVAANYLYFKAPRDGLTLAVPGRDWLLKPLLGFGSAKFDPAKFAYIGSTGETNVVAYINAKNGIKTVSDLRNSKKKILFGGLPGATTNTMVPLVLARLGWPVEVIRGYTQTSFIIHAMEHGELHAIYTPESSFARRRDLIDKGEVIQLFQSGRFMAGLPTIEDIVDPNDRRLLTLAQGQIPVGMPLVAPPETPSDTVAILRAAFRAMTTSHAFETPAKLIDEPYGAPLFGENLQLKIADLIASITPSAVQSYSEL